MKRLLLTLALLATIAAPASAHHVDVAVAESDRAALETYAAEMDAQVAAIIEALNLYGASVSASEKADAMLAVEGAMIAGIEHLASLPVPECAAEYVRLADAFMAAAAADFAAHKAGAPLAWELSNVAWNDFMAYSIAQGPLICRDEAVA